MYWLTGLAGFFLMVSPYFFSYANNPAALWTSLLTGGVVIAASWVEGVRKDRENWEYWIEAIFGIFAILSSFLFGFTNHAEAVWSTIAIGFLIAFLAASRLWIGPSTRRF